MSEQTTKTIRIVIDASRAVDGSNAATRAMEKLERQQAATGASLARMENALGKVGGLLKAQLGLAIADLSARMVMMAKGAIDAASGLDELAEQLGVTARGLQALQYSAVQNGTKLEQLETGLTKLSVKLGEAADGSKETIEALDRLGVKNLDMAGKLRPTEDVLTDVARAIMAIEDPSKRSAAAVDFFGKTGTRMLPMLKDVAGGIDGMAAAAERAGTMIGGYTASRLDQAGDAAVVAGLKLRKLFADSAVEILDWSQRNIDAIERIPIIGGIVQVVRNFDEVKAALGRMLEGVGDFTDSARTGLDNLYIAGARFAAGFGEAIRTIPEQLGKAFVDGMNLALEALESGLKKITGTLERNAPWLGIKESSASLGRLAGGGASFGDRNAAIRAAEDRAEADMRARGYGQDYAAARLAARSADAASAFYGSEGARLPTTGARTSTVKGAGDDVAERRRKALQDADRELEQAKAFADIAGQGAEAVAKLEAHFKAVKTAQDIFGKAAGENAAEVKKLAEQLEGTAIAAQKLKGLGEFSAATVELEKTNQLLATENALINATTEDRARGLALVKLQQEVQAKGLDETNAKEREAIERRREAISVNERLKGQGEELRKAQEMWTEPLKNALQSLQSYSADWLDGMLEKGTFTFSELANFGSRMARRIVAEFASLAIIRPMIGSMMGGLQSIGLVSPATAANLGYGGGYGGSSVAMPSTGGLGGMFSGSSGMLGSFGQWLNTPLTGPYAGMSPASMQGVPMLSPSLTNPSSWSITPLQGLGAIAGIGSGIFQLATGNGSTGSTIGGIGSMIGGAVSLIPGIGQIAGPLIALGSSLLGGLFGGGQQSYVDNQAYGQLNYGAGGWSTSGGAWGPSADARSLQQPLGQLGQSLDAIFGAFGGVKDPGKVWGMASETSSRTGGGWNLNQSWSYLIDPATGAKSLWRAGENNMLESGGAQVAIRSILGGAVGEITESMRTALYTVGQRGSSGSLGQVAQAVEFVLNVYDKLGKTSASAADAIKKLNAEFDSIASTAAGLGLSLAPVRDEQAKQVKRVAQDFLDGMLDPQAVAMRQLEDQRKDSIASAEYIRDNVKDVYVDMAKITEYWNRKRLDLEQQYQEQSVGQLQALIRRLTYGDLANASPDTSLAGTRGTYMATLAQARAGSGVARGSLAGAAEAYATSARSYFASSPEYDAIVREIRAAVSEVAAGTGGPAGGTAATNAANQETAELRAMVFSLVERLERQSEEISALTAQLQRRA